METTALFKRFGRNANSENRESKAAATDVASTAAKPAANEDAAGTAETTMCIMDGEPGETYIVKAIVTDDEDMDAFLFRLGCYSGEPITLISKKKSGCIVVIKDGRYNLDNLLSAAIRI